MGKMFAVIFMSRKLFLRIAGKITTIRKCNNFVPKQKKTKPFGTLKLFVPK